jgi:hypothetical protein
MAKKDKKAPEAEVETKGKKNKKAETAAEPKAKKESAPEFKFGVSDLAEKLGIKEASVRVQLRNRGIEKNGKSYGWNTKAELEEVAKQLKVEKAEKADAGDKKGKKAKAEEPAADAKAEKKAKKDKKKKD